MFCNNCGNPVHEDSLFCTICGQTLKTPQPLTKQQFFATATDPSIKKALSRTRITFWIYLPLSLLAIVPSLFLPIDADEIGGYFLIFGWHIASLLLSIFAYRYKSYCLAVIAGLFEFIPLLLGLFLFVFIAPFIAYLGPFDTLLLVLITLILSTINTCVLSFRIAITNNLWFYSQDS